MNTVPMILECPWCKTRRRVNVLATLPRMLWDCRRCHALVEVRPVGPVSPDAFAWMQEWTYSADRKTMERKNSND
jgi:hypothetical protein